MPSPMVLNAALSVKPIPVPPHAHFLAFRLGRLGGGGALPVDMAAFKAVSSVRGAKLMVPPPVLILVGLAIGPS
jgi:hypothetical protein